MFHVQSAFKCSFTDVYFNFFMSHNVLVDSVRCQYYLLSAAMLYGLLFTDAEVVDCAFVAARILDFSDILSFLCKCIEVLFVILCSI